MKLNDSNSIANGLDENNRSAILQLIDLKTESDMKDVLTKMDSMFTKIDAKFAHMEESIITTRWVIIAAGSIITILLAILALK
jgi:hypothetical protein